MTFSQRLKELRKATGKNQPETAMDIGIGATTYQQYEAGKVEPTLSKLCMIADYFGVTLDYLAGRTDKC